jgi:hypothetical protein
LREVLATKGAAEFTIGIKRLRIENATLAAESFLVAWE